MDAFPTTVSVWVHIVKPRFLMLLSSFRTLTTFYLQRRIGKALERGSPGYSEKQTLSAIEG